MHPLIEQLAAPGDGRIGTPFLIVADSPAVTVAAANEHQLAEGAAVDVLARLLHRWMKAMVESDFDDDLALSSGLDHRQKLGAVPGRRLFDQHVFSGLHGGEGDRRE